MWHITRSTTIATLTLPPIHLRETTIMRARSGFLVMVFGLWVAAGVPVRAEDAVSEILKISGLKKIDLAKLAAGEVEGSRIPAEGSDLTISVESLFAVPLAPGKVVDLMEDSTSATEVKASDTLDVEGHFAVSLPAREEDFGRLKISAEDGMGRGLMKASADGASLNLNAPEAAALAQTARDPAALEKAWRKVLTSRAQTFQTRGWVGSPTYDRGGRAFSMHQEMVRLLKTQPAILDRFKETIGAAMTAKTVPGMAAPGYYWEMSRIQGDRIFSLGAVFSRKMEGSVHQVIEPTYYVSSKYFTSIILYEIRPVTINGSPYSLVWRGDFVITPSINFMKGIERIAAENITLLEVQKSVRSFAEECRAAR